MLTFLLTLVTKAWEWPANVRWNPYADRLYQMLWGQPWGFYTAQRSWHLPALSQNMDPWQDLKQHRIHRAKVCLDGCCFPGVASGIVVLSWSSVMQTMDPCVCLTAVITYGINMCLPWLSIKNGDRGLYIMSPVSIPFLVIGYWVILASDVSGLIHWQSIRSAGNGHPVMTDRVNGLYCLFSDKGLILVFLHLHAEHSTHGRAQKQAR